MSEKYVVFDFETTGFSAQKNEIIQNLYSLSGSRGGGIRFRVPKRME